MSEVYCIGGFLSGKSVPNIGGEYIPISESDSRDYFSRDLRESFYIDKPKDKYVMYATNFGLFYIWNNEESLKDNLGNKYKNHEV